MSLRPHWFALASWLSLGGLSLGGLSLGACTDRDGIVEVYWQFEDEDLHRIFPVGKEVDTCELPSETGVHYDLRVRLTIVENSESCKDDWSNPDCQIIEPILFPCNRSRGTALSVPASANEDGTDPGYLMVVETLVDPTDTAPFVPVSTCVAGAGPRVRQVRPGRITDLEVYQFIVPAIILPTRDDPGKKLDIQACRPTE